MEMGLWRGAKGLNCLCLCKTLEGRMEFDTGWEANWKRGMEWGRERQTEKETNRHSQIQKKDMIVKERKRNCSAERFTDRKGNRTTETSIYLLHQRHTFHVIESIFCYSFTVLQVHNSSSILLVLSAASVAFYPSVDSPTKLYCTSIQPLSMQLDLVTLEAPVAWPLPWPEPQGIHCEESSRCTTWDLFSRTEDDKLGR